MNRSYPNKDFKVINRIHNTKETLIYTSLYYILLSLIIIKWILIPKTNSLTTLESTLKNYTTTISNHAKSIHSHSYHKKQSLESLLIESEYMIIESNLDELKLRISKRVIHSELNRLLILLNEHQIPISKLIIKNTKQDTTISIKLNKKEIKRDKTI